jgi:hypothetical protein
MMEIVVLLYYLNNEAYNQFLAMYDLRFALWSLRRAPSFGMWRRAGLVRTDISEERIASIFRLGRIRERGAALQLASRLNH